MAKSLWDDYDDEGNGPDEAKQPRGPRANKRKWWREDEEDDKPSIGFTQYRYVDDDRATDEYGGFGYSGPSYSYGDAFDDSDTDWYRKNSFRYGRHADYSPSSLFRSAFSGRSYYAGGGADDEAKNKAIRALRNLTRSANTIVDKTIGKRVDYAVQFSSGADSNGVTDALNDEKQRVVYVSPDELLATKTTEDEDAIVDALTGFVLLRVQISQGTETSIIEDINKTGLQSACLRAASAVFDNKGKLAGIDSSAFSKAVTAEYLAGLLAKSMLTRLARRDIVSSWGGFAPYFIRHAKKFTAVRENLEKAPQSVEVIVGKLGYNMLADENQIELPEEINKIASKHLGAEIKPEELLEACRKLVHEIQDFLRTSPETVPGEIESALKEMLEKAQAAQGSSGGNEEMRNFLEKIAESMAGVDDSGEKISSSQAAASTDAENIDQAIRETASLEQLIKKLEALKKSIGETKPGVEAGETHAKELLKVLQRDVLYALTARPNSTAALEKEKVKELGALVKTAEDSKPMDSAKVAKLTELIEELNKKAEKILAAQRKDLKKLASNSVGEMQKSLQEMATTLRQDIENVEKTREKIKDAKVPETEKLAGDLALERLADTAKIYLNKIPESSKLVEAAKRLIDGARSISTIDREYRRARYQTLHATANAEHIFGNHNGLRTNQTIAALIAELERNKSAVGIKLDTKTRIQNAVEAALNRATMADINFMASLIESFNDKAISKAMSEDGAARVKIAEKLGVSVEMLTKLISAMERTVNNRLSDETAKELGSQTLEKLSAAQEAISPVDGQLFGDKVEAKTKLLTGESIGHVNDEARNAPEEDFVAYLSHNECKPKVRVEKETYERRPGGDDSATTLKKIKAKNRQAIERVRNSLQFHSCKRSVETHGLLSGDLDEGSLHKLQYDCEHIWSQKTLSKLPDVAVGILVDQSGSMCGPKIERAREICIVLAEAIRKVVGVRLYVYGHTANMTAHDSLTIYEHYTPAMGSDLTQLGGIRSHSNNYDGYAIKDVAKRLSQDAAKKKYLFVIADGLPSGSGYGGDSAIKHVSSVCKFSRERLKIGTYAFAVGVPAHSRPQFQRQYGDKHVVFVDDVLKCLPQITRFLRNALQQERKLVGIEG